MLPRAALVVRIQRIPYGRRAGFIPVGKRPPLGSSLSNSNCPFSKLELSRTCFISGSWSKSFTPFAEVQKLYNLANALELSRTCFTPFGKRPPFWVLSLELELSFFELELSRTCSKGRFGAKRRLATKLPNLVARIQRIPYGSRAGFIPFLPPLGSSLSNSNCPFSKLELSRTCFIHLWVLVTLLSGHTWQVPWTLAGPGRQPWRGLGGQRPPPIMSHDV